MTPLFQLLLLTQHSYKHDFSTFKLALPTSFCLLVAPILAVSLVLKDKFGSKFETYKINISYLIILGILSISIISTSPNEVIKFAEKGSKVYQEMGTVISKNVAPNELPISDKTLSLTPENPSLIALWMPPQALWYSQRFIYAPEDFQNERLKANTQNFKGMKPVFLVYKEKQSEASVHKICQNKWMTVPETVKGREVVICKTPELKQLLLP